MSDNDAGADFRQVDLKKLVIPPMTLKKGNMSTNPVYDVGGGKMVPLAFQTPDVRMPFGLSDGKYAKDGVVVDGPPRYSIAGAFDRYREGGIMAEFFQFATGFEDYLVRLASANSKAWFGTKYTPEVCRALLNKWVHFPMDEEKAAKYDPTFKGTVRQKKDLEGVFWTRCIGLDGKPVDLSSIPPGCTGSMKLELSSIYVINGKFGATFEVKWVAVTSLSTAAVFDYKPNLYGTAPLPALPATTLQDAIEAAAPPTSAKRERSEEEVAAEKKTTAPVSQKRAKAAGGN